jgi:hypothetical protein
MLTTLAEKRMRLSDMVSSCDNNEEILDFLMLECKARLDSNVFIGGILAHNEEALWLYESATAKRIANEKVARRASNLKVASSSSLELFELYDALGQHQCAAMELLREANEKQDCEAKMTALQRTMPYLVRHDLTFACAQVRRQVDYYRLVQTERCPPYSMLVRCYRAPIANKNLIEHLLGAFQFSSARRTWAKLIAACVEKDWPRVKQLAEQATPSRVKLALLSRSRQPSVGLLAFVHVAHLHSAPRQLIDHLIGAYDCTDDIRKRYANEL